MLWCKLCTKSCLWQSASPHRAPAPQHHGSQQQWPTKLSEIVGPQLLDLGAYRRMSKILDGLWLGDVMDAYNEVRSHPLGCSAILNTAQELDAPKGWEGEYLHLPIPDESPGFKLPLREAVGFIARVRDGGGTVLVHCRQGISRSALICMAYLVAHQGYTHVDAYHFVVHRRIIVQPFDPYLAQYQRWAQSLPTPDLSSVGHNRPVEAAACDSKLS